ncbi:hypothetical protein D3C86_1173990 [compost metagenome]
MLDALGVDGVDRAFAHGEHAVALLGPLGRGGAVHLDAVLIDRGVGVAVPVEVEDQGIACLLCRLGGLHAALDQVREPLDLRRAGVFDPEALHQVLGALDLDGRGIDLALEGRVALAVDLLEQLGVELREHRFGNGAGIPGRTHRLVVGDVRLLGGGLLRGARPLAVEVEEPHVLGELGLAVADEGALGGDEVAHDVGLVDGLAAEADLGDAQVGGLDDLVGAVAVGDHHGEALFLELLEVVEVEVALGGVDAGELGLGAQGLVGVLVDASLGVDGVDGVVAEGQDAVALLGPVGVGGAVDLDAALADGGVGVAVAVEVEDDGVASNEALGGLGVVALVDGVLVDLVLVVGGEAVEIEGASLAGGLELLDVLGGLGAILDAAGGDGLDGLGDGLHLLGLATDDRPGDDGGDAARGDARVAHCLAPLQAACDVEDLVPEIGKQPSWV